MVILRDILLVAVLAYIVVGLYLVWKRNNALSMSQNTCTIASLALSVGFFTIGLTNNNNNSLIMGAGVLMGFAFGAGFYILIHLAGVKQKLAKEANKKD